MMKKALLSLLLAFVCLPSVFAQTNPGLTVNVDTVVSCQDYIWPYNNQTYTHDTVDMYLSGDTAFMLIFTRMQSYVDTAVAINLVGECSASLNGHVWTTPGNFLDTLTTVGGCDSVVKVHVELANADTMKSVMACGSYNAPWGGVYTESRLIDTVIVKAGCTYHPVIDLTVNPVYPDITIDTVAGCTFQWGSVTITDTALHTYNLKTVGGQCDSIVNIRVTAFNGQQYDTVSRMVCDFYKPAWSDTLRTSGLYSHDTLYGTYYVNSTTTQPCTHHETLDLTVVTSKSDTAGLTPTAVEAGCSYLWGGQTITDTLVHFHKFTSVIGGCDSMAAIQVSFTGMKYDTTYAKYCGDTYNWKNSCPTLPLPGNAAAYAFSRDTVYSVNVTDTTNGCTTVYVLNLEFYTKSDTVTDYYCGNAYEYTYKALRLRTTDSVWVWQNATTSFTASGYYQVAENGDTLFSTALGTNCKTYRTLNLTLRVPDQRFRADSIDTAACEEFVFRIDRQYGRRVTVRTDCDSDFVHQQHVQVEGENCYDSIVHVTLVINHNTFIERTATECDSYVWSEFDGNTYTATGVYRDTLSERTSEGCLQIGRLTLTIHNTPVVNIIGNWILQPGDNTVLKAEVENGSDAIRTYRWYVNNNMQSSSDSLELNNVTSNTDVRLEATSIHNCTATNWLTVTANVGIDETADALQVNVYPNPASRYLNIESEAPMSDVAVYNAVGQQVILHQADGTSARLDLGSLATGTYTLRINGADGSQTIRKFIVNK